MYNLKEKSWHYRLIKLLTSDPAHSDYAIRNTIYDEKVGMFKSETVDIQLCPYVQTLLGCMFICFIMFLISCLLLTSAGVFLLDLFSFMKTYSTDYYFSFYVFGYITVIFILCLWLDYLLERPNGTLDKYRAKREAEKYKKHIEECENHIQKSKERKNKQKGIFKIYVEALHNKMCPVIRIEK